jgi:coproporphyrinogen III oxidase
MTDAPQLQSTLGGSPVSVEVAALREEVARLTASLEGVQAQVRERWERGQEGEASKPRPQEPASDGATGRRRLLKGAGLAAAGVAVAALAGKPESAEASVIQTTPSTNASAVFWAVGRACRHRPRRAWRQYIWSN